jgi:hypothetical protein
MSQFTSILDGWMPSLLYLFKTSSKEAFLNDFLSGGKDLINFQHKALIKKGKRVSRIT